MKKLVSIVHNSVTRDTRVQKEAISTSRLLHIPYIIVGLKDQNDNRNENKLDDNVTVVRLSPEKVQTTLFNAIKNFLFSKIGVLASIIALSLYSFVTFIVASSFVGALILNLTNIALALFSLLFFRPNLIEGKGKFLQALSEVLFDARTTVVAIIRYNQYSDIFIEKLKELKPDILHAHDLPMLIVATTYKKEFPHTKIVFDAHELFEHMSSRGSIFRFIFKKYLYHMSKRVDGFVTINQSFKDYFSKHYPYMPPAYVVKNATPSSLLVNKGYKSSKIREIIPQIKENQKILLYQGGYSAPRGLDLIIKASTKIADNWVIVFMGWGNIEEDLKTLAKKMNVYGSKVFFIPPANISELTDWTSSADIGIIPYLNTCLNHYYCTPNKLWEYPIAGLPILTPDYPELARPIKQYNIGWLIDEMSAEKIAEAVNKITEAELQEKQEGIEEYFNNESWDTYEKELEKCYRALL